MKIHNYDISMNSTWKIIIPNQKISLLWCLKVMYVKYYIMKHLEAKIIHISHGNHCNFGQKYMKSTYFWIFMEFGIDHHDIKSIHPTTTNVNILSNTIEYFVCQISYDFTAYFLSYIQFTMWQTILTDLKMVKNWYWSELPKWISIFMTSLWSNYER